MPALYSGLSLRSSPEHSASPSLYLVQQAATDGPELTATSEPRLLAKLTSGQGVGWINRYLDREYVRRLADKSLYSYAHSLLNFVRWWESVHHTGEITAADLTKSTLFDYVRLQ